MFDRLQLEEIKECTKEVEKLIEKYGDRTVYRLEPIYIKYGVDIVNKVRENLRGKVLGL